MIVAFTGPSYLYREQELAVVARMEELDYQERNGGEFVTWRSGCAYGVDTIAARQAILSDVLSIEMYVPAAIHNHDLVEELGERVRVIRLPVTSEPYRKRNEAMVTGADLLVAFVKSRSFYRSGEWMTVNIARKLGVEVDLNVI